MYVYIFMYICSLHHGIPLFLLGHGFLLFVPFIYAIDHYDEEYNCKKTQKINK